MRKSGIALAIAVGCFALPATAGAATKTVAMGLPAKDQAAFNKTVPDASINDFFPRGTTIHVGDSVKFVPTGFHDVNLPGKGDKGSALIIPTGKKVSGANDAAGAAFWFNGLDALGFNPVLFKSGFGKSFTYNGKKGVESGLPTSEKPKPLTVKFTKAGSFTFVCNVHPGMFGTVKVVGAKAKLPSAAADAKALKKQVATALSIAKSLGKTPPANTVDLGSAGANGVERFSMFPAKTTVPAGTTVTFTMTPKSREVHTATFGPGDAEKPTTYIGKLAASFDGPAPDPIALYPSDPPFGGVPSLTAALHGNGFVNTGGLDTDKTTAGPLSGQIKFDQAGTYTFYCLIHPFMKGTVVVT